MGRGNKKIIIIIIIIIIKKNLSDQQNIVGTPLSCRQENGQVFRFTNLSKLKQIFLLLLKTRQSSLS